LGFGGWGLGFWGWGMGPNPQSPNPQSPIPNPQLIYEFFFVIKKIIITQILLIYGKFNYLKKNFLNGRKN